MKLRQLLYTGLCVLSMVSCADKDDTMEEYPDWKNTNERAFLSVYNEAKTAIESGSTAWKLLRSVNRPDSLLGGSYSPEDYVVVEVVDEDPEYAEWGTPLQTDTVSIHYIGYLQPSTSYPAGRAFDQSYYGNYQPGVSEPYDDLTASGYIDGFSTALQHMHVGDHWFVHIPYQLGYGEAANGDIPAYSMLTFELRLVGFW